MKKTNEEINEEKIDTILAEDIDFQGTLKFSNSLLIKGKFEGEINSEEGHLYIGDEAKVSARIKAASVTNLGEVIGDVETTERVILKSGSVINGDVITPELLCDPGGVINGNLTMTNRNPIPQVD